MNATVKTTKYRIEGMDCASCAMKIDTAVRRMPGVEDVSVSATAGTMTLHYIEGGDLLAIEKKVTGLGYGVSAADKKPQPTPVAQKHVHDHYDHDHEGCDHAQHNHDHDDHEHDHHKHAHQTDHNEAAIATPSAVEGLHEHDHGPMTGVWWQSSKAKLAAASGVALLVAFAVGHFYPSISAYAYFVAMAVGLAPIAKRAFMAAIAGIPFSIEMLMTIAAIGAVIINAGEEAATVVFLFLVGELLEGVAAGKARESIQALTALVPKTAFIEQDGKTTEVPAESLQIGAIILVRPGDRIPADGTILSGTSLINEASVTGESMPVRKTVDAPVFAGTINGEAALRINVTATAADNTIARVVRLVEEAQESKSPTERFIDRFSRYYTPGVLAVGGLVAVLPPLLLGASWAEWIYKGLAILLIGCPCALVISTPAAIAASLSAGARRGLLLKGGAVLETLGKIKVVAFDKTGTLTEGKPVVTDIVSVGHSDDSVLQLAAALETGSSHPLAVAILAKAKERGLEIPPATAASAIGGKGVTGQVDGKDLFLGSPNAANAIVSLSADLLAQISTLNDSGKSVAVLLVSKEVAGLLAMRDEPRSDARQGIEALHQVGIKTVMLTGDNQQTAKAIGTALGIQEVHAELLPEDKQRLVKQFQGQGFKIAKVGDGINDAPALAMADVGIAMGGGTDVALETADAAILHGRVGDVAEMVLLSKRTMGNIKQNLMLAIGLKGVFLVTTIIGVTGLWPAILADTGATVLVTLNALRLLVPGEAKKQ